jgi:carbon storage regulator
MVLVLTRRIEESFMIGNQILVTVLGVEGDKVKVGVAAPRDIPILRHELYLAVRDQNLAAAQSPSSKDIISLHELQRIMGSPSSIENRAEASKESSPSFSQTT